MSRFLISAIFFFGSKKKKKLSLPLLSSPVLVPDELAQRRHVPLRRPREPAGKLRLPEQRRARVAHPRREGDRPGQPRVERRRPDLGDVRPEGAVDACFFFQ